MVASWYSRFGKILDQDSNKLAIDLVEQSGRRSGAQLGSVIDEFRKTGVEFSADDWDRIRGKISDERMTELREWASKNEKNALVENLRP